MMDPSVSQDSLLDLRVCCTYQGCDVTFRNMSELQRHIRIHTGDRPFKCDKCSKAFARKACLTRHKAVHAKDTPFNCKQLSSIQAISERCMQSATPSGELKLKFGGGGGAVFSRSSSSTEQLESLFTSSLTSPSLSCPTASPPLEVAASRPPSPPGMLNTDVLFRDVWLGPCQQSNTDIELEVTFSQNEDIPELGLCHKDLRVLQGSL
eukprot:gene3866-29241_t